MQKPWNDLTPHSDFPGNFCLDFWPSLIFNYNNLVIIFVFTHNNITNIKNEQTNYAVGTGYINGKKFFTIKIIKQSKGE